MNIPKEQRADWLRVVNAYLIEWLQDEMDEYKKDPRDMERSQNITDVMELVESVNRLKFRLESLSK